MSHGTARRDVDAPNEFPPERRGTLLLSRADVERLLTLDACIAAVEEAFRQHALGRASQAILGLHAPEGSFHVKAALLTQGRPCFAAKVNANFPHNDARFGLPTIQGIVVLHDATNGYPLAVLDSAAITALRTAAATAVAAKHLARRNSDTALICGCGAQAPAQARALLRVPGLGLKRLLVFDRDLSRAEAFAVARGAELALPVVPVPDLGDAVAQSDVVVTCTPSPTFFVTREMVRAGTFVAAVGADSEHKQEIDPRLLAAATVVTDLTEQACAIGDLHHAIRAGVMSRDDVHAELGEIVIGRKTGRTRDDEILVFDSTGTGLQDAAAALATYRLARESGAGVLFPV